MEWVVRPGDADESQGEEDQGDGCHPCLLVGDASQDGIESPKIPLGHDVRWGGEWVGVDRVVEAIVRDGDSVDRVIQMA